MFVTGDGTTLLVRDSDPHGQAEATLVITHGWTLDHTSWERVVALIAGAFGSRVRVVQYDHRGHGGSDPARPGAGTLEQLADDLAELITERVPDGPVVLAGHSMGGMTMFALAERHPELVRDRIAGTAFVATSCDMTSLTLGLPTWLAAPVLYLEALVNRGLARLRRGQLLANPPAVVRPFIRWLVFGRKANRLDVIDTAAQIGKCHPASMVSMRNSMGVHNRPAAIAAFSGIPAVVLAGTRDRLTPVSHARQIAADLPDADFVVYPGAGHMLTYERTPEVADQLVRLITAVTTAKVRKTA
ncbi:pimeloyl-ACP methyl ester carboxylesterase [Herbihabitans rhizosphaerae]|uniref:Pimeloyl-ACP methyl ester carboxylesterase n=1 Tax=Herbihabitans rhizosphaerae TaxID=1872711 RepID=A0A4Q7L4M7_9PSEU|nr:alpha/beta hydrolase [Herbihabitans rhizosphaerae]RZS44227.1 pimeloyl-ACP methyl ester carboxylesterase [Herbihabitans rhizosphaerae]